MTPRTLSTPSNSVAYIALRRTTHRGGEWYYKEAGETRRQHWVKDPFDREVKRFTSNTAAAMYWNDNCGKKLFDARDRIDIVSVEVTLVNE